MKLLIVEDSEKMREMIKSFVANVAEEVFECTDGAEAFTAYEQQQPDWVLMDIEMADVDGLTATRQIKAAWPEARIMIVTNYDDEALREAAHDAGASEYVLKPNLPDIRRILGTQ